MRKKTADLYEFFVGELDVNFKPSNESEEILQNVKTICATPKGSRPMDRDFGINPFDVDKPMLKEMARVIEEITQAIKKYEPRAELLDISMRNADPKGAYLQPYAQIRIKNNNA